MMKCPLCGYKFDEEDGRAACRGCPLSGNCRMVRCPNCNYDVPAEPGLIKALRAWRRKDDGTRRKG